MKKVMILMLVFLTGCQSVSNNITNQPIQAFEISEKCSHVCWLGINPSITSVEDAEALLRASNQIDQKTIVGSGDNIQVLWFTDKTKNLYSYVYLTYRKGLVQTIDFSTLSNFTLNDFTAFFGEPDEITIQVEQAPHGWISTYTLYYSASKTMIYTLSGGLEGPNPNDFIDDLSLNAEFDGSDLPPWRADDYENRQPWLGYGHIEDYLPGLELPIEPNGTSQP